MLFADTNRIDLSLKNIDHQHIFEKDSLTKVLLDKDNLFPNRPVASDKDYWIKQPNEKQFLDCCNEFWWVSTYVVKGLSRKEVLYAKNQLESPLRNMFLCMISWYIGVNAGFSINLGQCYKYIPKYVEKDIWESIQNTYPDTNEENIRKSLREMIQIFPFMAKKVAQHFAFQYPREEAEKVYAYLVKIGL